MTHAGELILITLAAYAVPGLLFAALFVWRGAGAIDRVARGAPVRVRLLFAPGALALWPMLALRWRRAPSEGEEAR